MDKALSMGKVSATGSFHLFLGVAVSTIIMAVGTIILARLLLPEEYGLYSLSLIPSYMINLFRDWGVNSAMTRYVANLRISNKNGDIRDIIHGGIIFETITGLGLTFLSLFLASLIATTIFHRPEATSLIAIASLVTFSGALLVAAQSSFIGFENMKLNSFTLICQAVVKVVVGLLLILLGFGVLGAVLGYVLSFSVAGIIGLVLLYTIFLRNLQKSENRAPLSEVVKKMLRYGVPLSISSILTGFLLQFYSFMMVIFSSDEMIGNYQVATNFAVLLTFFSAPITTVLFPAFAKLDPQNEKPLLKTIFASSVKYTSLILVPATMAIMVLSQPMVSTLFGEKWVHSPLFLTLYVSVNLLAALGSISLGGFLAGVGETRIQMRLGILKLLVGIPLAFLLIPTYGILGVIVGSILAGLPSLFWGLLWTWKHYEVRADFRNSTEILTASIIAAIATFVLISFFNTAEWIKLVVGGIVFLVAYLITTSVVGAVTLSDIKNLKVMFSGLGIVSKLIDVPLIIVEETVKRASKSTRIKKDAEHV